MFTKAVHPIAWKEKTPFNLYPNRTSDITENSCWMYCILTSLKTPLMSKPTSFQNQKMKPHQLLSQIRASISTEVVQHMVSSSYCHEHIFSVGLACQKESVLPQKENLTLKKSLHFSSILLLSIFFIRCGRMWLSNYLPQRACIHLNRSA